MSSNRRLYLYTALEIALGFGALAIVTALLPVDPAIAIVLPGAPSWSGVLLGLALWTALTLVGSALASQRPAGAIVTFDMPFIAAAAVLGGPVAAGWVAMLGSLEIREIRGAIRREAVVSATQRQVPWYGILANHGQTTFAAIAGALALAAASPPLDGLLGGGGGRAASGTLVSTALVALVFVIVTDGIAFRTLALRSERSVTDVLDAFGLDHWVTTAAGVVLAWLMIEVFTVAGWWAPVACVAAVVAAWSRRPQDARLDPLTGLLPDADFRRRVGRVVERARRGRQCAVVLRVEVQDLDLINRQLGRRGGDQILKVIGHRLRASLRPLDDAARQDDPGVFGALLVLRDDALVVSRAEAIAQRLLAKLQIPIVVDGRQIAVRLAIGVAVEERGLGPVTADALLKSARWACRAAQAEGIPVEARSAGPILAGEGFDLVPPDVQPVVDANIAVLVERGDRALADHAADPASVWDPLLPVVLRYLDEVRGGRRDRARLLRHWQGRPIQAEGPRRFRWAIDGYDDPEAPFRWSRRPGQDRIPWPRLETSDLRDRPTSLATRLTLPPILAGALAFLDETGRSEPSLAREAGELLDEALPKIESDVARHVAADDAWEDTFALWSLTRDDLVLDRLDLLAVAIATRFASRANVHGDRVLGTRAPFFETPLESASAHLAAALWALGLQPRLLGPLVEWLRGRQRADGGWGDGEQPSDLLTTLVVADLLMRLDPGFTLEDEGASAPGAAGGDAGGGDNGRQAARRVVAFFAARQEPAGWWRVLDPETPWLTVEICRWLRAIQQPFHARFRWPHLPAAQRDRKTGVPLFAFYEDLGSAARRLGPLAGTPLEVAFLDLIDFGRWNKRFGQQRGDDLLAVLAATLLDIPETLVVRDGGDEFLIVGKPGLTGVLRGRLEATLDAWSDRCRARLPDVEHVEARIVLGGAAMADAREIRERLGRAVGEIKDVVAEVPGCGVLAILEGSRVTVVRGRRPGDDRNEGGDIATED